MIEYVSRAHKSPKTGDVKYYADVKNSTPIDVEGISELIANGTTVTVVDVKAVLRALEDKIIYLLINGHTVRLGDLGSFHLTITSAGVATQFDVNETCIEQLRVRFMKSANMIHSVRKGAPGVHFTKIKNAEEVKFDQELKDVKEIRKEEYRKNQQTLLEELERIRAQSHSNHSDEEESNEGEMNAPVEA